MVVVSYPEGVIQGVFADLEDWELCQEVTLYPSDLWFLSLDHVLELWDWMPKHQSSIQLVSRLSAVQHWCSLKVELKVENIQ